jgi:L-alanine-DL-glutamate epimerase-like enolase superfamily enzyme
MLTGEVAMRITDVEAMVLDTGKDYADPQEAVEAHGVRFVALIKVTTDAGICGWSDVETQPHVGRAIVTAPSGGQVGFESLRAALIGEDPLERARLWQKAYRYLAYYGRQAAGMQMLSGVDIALWDIAGKACEQPVSALLGAKYRDRVKAYASTLFRPTPDAMKRAVDDYLGRGFRAIKSSWGVFRHDLKLDITLKTSPAMPRLPHTPARCASPPENRRRVWSSLSVWRARAGWTCCSPISAAAAA